MKPVVAADVLRASVLPTIFLFLLPAFGLWFSGHAARVRDEAFFTYISREIAREPSMSPAERDAARAFYRAMPPSRACGGDPSVAARELAADLGDGCDDYAQFRIAGQVSATALGLSALAVLVAVLGALAAHLSRAAEYRSFVLSFQALRVLTALITILQAALVVWLAFWTTAIWWEVYYVKLVLIAGALALFAVVALLSAIFARIPRIIPVNGLIVSKEKAGPLFERLEAICAELGTRPPDHLVAGIDDNFFVCEGEIDCPNGIVEGRVLYVSLSLLRILGKREAEAVLVHEMAHFSGGDVEHSTKLAPSLNRFDVYVRTLYQSPLAYPVARFLLAFRSLFQLSLGRSHRERELVADATAARLISPDDIARALVRIGAYASFGSHVERALFEKNEQHESLSIAERIDHGFSDYLGTSKVAFDLVGAAIPHPFDTHPPLVERLENVGVKVAEEELVALIALTPEDRHYESIEGADELEATQWKTYEEQFRQNHEIALVHRYEPSTPEQRALVEKYFPKKTFAGKDGGVYVTLDCLELNCRDFAAPIRWEEIKNAQLDDRWSKKPLDITLVSDGMLTKKHSVKTHELETNAAAFLAEFNRYWTRARSSAAYRKANGL